MHQKGYALTEGEITGACARARRQAMRNVGVPAACVRVMADLHQDAGEVAHPTARLAGHTLALLSSDAPEYASQARPLRINCPRLLTRTPQVFPYSCPVQFCEGRDKNGAC